MKYELPTASESRLGGIRVGEDFEIDQDGTLNIKDMEEMKEQVEELPQKVAAGKSLIAEAITEKGVPTEATDSFATMAENIRQISGGGGGESYLPASDPDEIICEAFAGNFDPDSLTWGNGSSPIILTDNVSLDYTGKAVIIPVKTTNSATMAYVDLEAPNTPFTAYVVMKASNPTKYSRMISSTYIRESAQAIILYGPSLTACSWGADTDMGIPTTDYFVGCIQFEAYEKSLCAAYDNDISIKCINRRTRNAGQYITLGRTDIDPSTLNAEPCDIVVKYCGVVKGVDSRAAILQNLATLVGAFL